MKKIIYLLILFVFSGMQVSFGQQKGQPIRSYKMSGYTISEVKRFAMDDYVLSRNWRNNFITLVNRKSKDAGINLVLNETDLPYVFDHYIKYERIELKDFTNSRRFGDVINFYEDHNLFNGEVGVFYYGNCRIILFKTICMNLLDIPVDISTVDQIDPDEKPVVSTTTKKGDTYIINNNNYNNSNYNNGSESQPEIVVVQGQPCYTDQYSYPVPLTNYDNYERGGYDRGNCGYNRGYNKGNNGYCGRSRGNEHRNNGGYNHGGGHRNNGGGYHGSMSGGRNNNGNNHGSMSGGRSSGSNSGGGFSGSGHSGGGRSH
jgi:hypothetical protein